jgi:hypothetical protein
MGDGLGLDAWRDEPAYKAAQGTFTERGAFIPAKLEGPRREDQGRAELPPLSKRDTHRRRVP